MGITCWTLCADLLRRRRAHLLVVAALLMTGCMSVTPPPGREVNLGYMPRTVAGARLAEQPTQVGGHLSRKNEQLGRQSATQAHRAVRAAVDEVSASLRALSGSFPQLAVHR